MNTVNAHDTAADQALINDLFAEFDIDSPADEIVLNAETPAVEDAMAEVDLDLDLSELEAAEPAVEAVAAEEAPAEAAVEVDPLAELGLDGVDFDLDLGVEASLAPALDETEATAAPAKPKETKVKPKASSGSNRVTYYNSSKSTVLLDRLGGNKELIILEASDLDLSKEELQAKRQHLLDIMNNQPTTVNEKGDPVKSTQGQTVQKKVAEKVIQLFTYMNRGGNLNKVMALAFQTLLQDGHLTFGKQGNMQAVLAANGYKDGTVRAQSGQIQQLFPLLKIAVAEGGVMKANPESIILAKIQADLFPQQAA